jgi:GGDEF domain-containing protein
LPVSTSRRIAKRYRDRLLTGQMAMDRLLSAIQTLLQASTSQDPLFLAHGLDILVGQLGADLAYLVSVEGTRFETRWWSPDRGESDPPAPILAFCRWLADHPSRTMVLRDIPRDGRLGKLPELHGRSVHAALGVALWHGGQVKGLVFAHFRKPQSFDRAELALLGAVAGFMGRILEVEDLKASLGRLENALAITKAVMEDSSIQDPATDLPNLRYLDIWMKANLGAGRKPEPMALALFRAPVGSRKDLGRLRLAAEQIRGTDLLVAAGEDRFLVLLLGATKGLAQILLMRLRSQLDGVPMGATLWFPDGEDAVMEAARRRAEEAQRECEEDGTKAIQWKVPEGPPALLKVQRPEPAAQIPPTTAPSDPRPWQPGPLSALSPGGIEPGLAAPVGPTFILPPKKRTKGG